MSAAARQEPGSSRATRPRRAAFEVVRRTFEAGAWTDRAFASAAARFGLEGSDLGQARRLTYGTVQRRATADHLIARLAGRSPAKLDPAVLAALRLGIFELVLDEPAAAHAAVDQAVELAKAGLRRDGAPAGRARAAANMVNAVLRRAGGERDRLLDALDETTPEAAAIALSYPVWMARMWWRELGAGSARALMAAMNEPAETALRANTLRTEPARIAAELRAAGVDVTGPGAERPLPLADALVVRAASEPVQARIATGELVPQSRGSQAVVALLDPQPGDRVLDLCAGPGLKTTQIAARMRDRGEIVSFEVDPKRAAEVERLCARTGVGCARVEVADAAEAAVGSGYDRVLVDAPCSDLGTLASRPDARWRKSPEQIGRLAELGRRLAVRGARALRPGGTLVYSTCTISARENEGVAAELPDRVPELVASGPGADERAIASRRDARFFQIRPDRDRTTGFFIARFRRREE